ncbi:hypothetical protein AKJ52_01090 [candidate division MSBL1 archaeon SCGC-AAA382C18]|uniref:DUF401 family protein n=1 Tax=candidate division MSBL1 archaeon SCGC-AAA382C18 TaxID=1698281 RepID=A0A133VKR2_9EURY|nr:hypothetical protein AKJ52_01090 [candidate division MSBL1 archaeon SCGC-AAA382C18]
MIEWFGFLVSIIILLVGSRFHLGLSLFVGGVVLGLFTISPSEVLNQVYLTFTEPSIVVLALALSMIPIIAGLLQESGGLDRIVENLRIGKRGFLGLSPALLGLLPIPGGALFSAPLIDRAGVNLRNHVKAGINIWFRHILFFIYPLAPALIIPASIAGISVYTVILYQFPFFLLLIGIGYLFLLRNAEGDMGYDSVFSLKDLAPPLAVILVAPILNFGLQNFFQFGIREISTFFAILGSLLLALYLSDFRGDILEKSIRKTEPWNFVLIIFGIFTFINIFESSGIGSMISTLSPSRMLLSIGFGFFLGLVTGRISLPASIIIPIFLTTFSFESLPPLVFAMIYFSIFMGYVITPIHPCVGLSLEYFDSEIGSFLKVMVLPVGLSMAVVSFVFFLLI